MLPFRQQLPVIIMSSKQSHPKPSNNKPQPFNSKPTPQTHRSPSNRNNYSRQLPPFHPPPPLPQLPHPTPINCKPFALLQPKVLRIQLVVVVNPFDWFHPSVEPFALHHHHRTHNNNNNSSNLNSTTPPTTPTHRQAAPPRPQRQPRSAANKFSSRNQSQ